LVEFAGDWPQSRGAVLVTRLVLVVVFFALPTVPFAGVYWWLVRKYERGGW